MAAFVIDLGDLEICVMVDLLISARDVEFVFNRFKFVMEHLWAVLCGRPIITIDGSWIGV